MSLKQNIYDDLKNAMKTKNELVSLVLRSLISEINAKEIELKKKDEGLMEEEIEQIVVKEIKKRQDAAAQYKSGGREELAKNEEEEMKVLEKYAPEKMSEADLNKLIDDTINSVGAQGIQDVGRVRGAVMKHAGASVDGNVVSRLVREKLQ